MLSRNLRSFLAFALLAIGIFVFRADHGTALGLGLTSALAIAFWYLNGLNFAVSSLRNMLMLAALFAAVLVGARLIFPSVSDSVKMGHLEGGDLDPALIARLKNAHEVALQLYFDHKPTLEERYYKVGRLSSTQDGFHYLRSNAKLDLDQMPRAAAWVRGNLTSKQLDRDIERIEAWYRAGFTYTLAPGALRAEHPLDEFLFESKKGFCEHYAASLATLLKLRGNRAQVIVGYAGGSWNPLLGRLTYEESDAHAWVEVSDPTTHLWRIVDPTDWVMTYSLPSAAGEWKPWAACILVLLLATALGFVVLGKADGLEALLKKVHQLEQKHELPSTGLTVSERISRLTVLYPDRAARMRESLTVYLSSYFESEPGKSSRRKLYRSLAKW